MDELRDKVDALEIVLSNLGSKDRTFASSLIDSYRTRGGLSPKQTPWISTLLARAMGKETGPQAVVKILPSFKGLYALFAAARKTLKYPKLRLAVAGKNIVVSLSGAKSKVPYTVNVAEDGEFGVAAWYGRILEDGTWTQGKAYPELPAIESFLRELSTAPAETATKYGKLTGRCMFCGKSLTHEHSTSAGFGPECAKKWGLYEQWKKSVGILKLVG